MLDDDRSDYVDLVVLDAALDARLRVRFAAGLMAQAECPRTVAQALAAQIALEAASEPGALRFAFGGTTLYGGWMATMRMAPRPCSIRLCQPPLRTTSTPAAPGPGEACWGR